jgi:GTP cyclohydrolase IA
VSETGIDLAAAESAAAALLDALGIDRSSGPLAGTPRRIARAYAELLTPREFSLTTFPNDEDYDELVIARDIPFTSVCEHHLLPFIGTAIVAYLPDERILGLSKLARVVELFARRPQVQERMTTQIAHWLDDNLAPKGVGIVVQAEHTCMTPEAGQSSWRSPTGARRRWADSQLSGFPHLLLSAPHHAFSRSVTLLCASADEGRTVHCGPSSAQPAAMARSVGSRRAPGGRGRRDGMGDDPFVVLERWGHAAGSRLGQHDHLDRQRLGHRRACA